MALDRIGTPEDDEIGAVLHLAQRTRRFPGFLQSENGGGVAE